MKKTKRSIGNTDVNGTSKNVSDLITYGDTDAFQLIAKASSKKQKWMKSTKAYEIKGVGCLVQVTTLEGNKPAEALTFVPNTCIALIDGDVKNGRCLVQSHATEIGDDTLAEVIKIVGGVMEDGVISIDALHIIINAINSLVKEG